MRSLKNDCRGEGGGSFLRVLSCRLVKPATWLRNELFRRRFQRFYLDFRSILLYSQSSFWVAATTVFKFFVFFIFMFLKFQHCSCKYYGTSHCTTVFIDEEKKIKFFKKTYFILPNRFYFEQPNYVPKIDITFSQSSWSNP